MAGMSVLLWAELERCTFNLSNLVTGNQYFTVLIHHARNIPEVVDILENCNM